MIEYDVGNSKQTLAFSDAVLEHFRRRRQIRPWQKEAGGQLFARLLPSRVVIEEATGPRRTDRRTRSSYVPDRNAEQREIVEKHALGLHYVGDWHTHPEKYGAPSCSDMASIAECFARSTHQLNAFVLVVVGSASLPDGLYVAINNAMCSVRLPAPR